MLSYSELLVEILNYAIYLFIGVSLKKTDLNPPVKAFQVGKEAALDTYEGHSDQNAGRFGLDDSKVSSNNQPTTNTEEDKGNGWVVFHLICGFVCLVFVVFGFLLSVNSPDEGFVLAIIGITGAIASLPLIPQVADICKGKCLVTAAGGVLITKSKDLSAYTVIATGRTFPALSCVRALNCLQNSMMLTPFAPKAGPTGGEGFAAPPLTCNLMSPIISFAIILVFNLL